MSAYQVTVSDIKLYADERGIQVPEDAVLSQRLILATDTLDGMESNFKGDRTDPMQANAWPRRNVVIRGLLVQDDQIPNVVKTALMQCTLDMRTNKELIETGEDKPKFAIKRTKTDVLETEYAVGTYAQSAPEATLGKVYRLLTDVLLYTPGQGSVIR